ncbi:MAG TPA: alpha/beta fold hydrolase [Rhodanobacteraceae bacterium]|jgi:pimeloyl-ACP methyl ester carboxylesterase|nr:alpha/beta fold hydrolase [Rhodanobacteraceae bacterium]
MRENAGQATVVCVHGAGGGGWEWGIWARVLAVRGFEVIAPDLMPVAAGLEKTSFAAYREQVVDWCRGAGEGVALVGASLGGLLALAVAQTVKPAALVLVNPLPPAGVLARPLHASWPSIVPWGSERSLATTRRAMPDADDAARLYALRRWRDESGTVLNEARDGVVVDTPRCPTLLLASEFDEDFPAAAARALAVRFSADLRSIPGASHVGPLLGRSAAQTAAEVAEWLDARRPVVAA